MEEKLGIKTNALELLEKQLSLRARKKQYGFIVISSATDPYLHFEKEEKLTRQILEIVLKYKFPVHIITKSNLVTRDFDLLHEINNSAILPDDLNSKLKDKVIITFSFSGIDDEVGAIFEPGATPPSQRLVTLKAALDDGFLSGVSLMPLLPFITDTGENLEFMFRTFQSIGVKYIFPSTLTLFGNDVSDSKTLMLRAVEKHYPHLLEKYHKFFDSSQEMPRYYATAFNKKMQELCNKYAIPNRIV